MSSPIFPIPENVQELSQARHRIDWVIEDINLVLLQMRWVAEGARDPVDLPKHRSDLKKLLGNLKREVCREAQIDVKHRESRS